MKTTPFTNFHIALSAKMAEFAGYNMPIEYIGINAEHAAVRNSVGLFDVSHMGEIWVKGPKAFDFVQRVTTNNVAALYDGKIQYSCFPNGKGGIVDDLLVYRIDEQTYLLVVNASNTQKDWDFLCEQAVVEGLEIGRELYNASDEIAQIAVQGPNAMKVVQKITEEKIEDMSYYTFAKCTVAGIKGAILSATGYTGSGGCEIYVANEDAATLWEAVMVAGEEFGIQPVGLGARDTLRLEMGFSLYGHEIDDTTSPIEAGLGWITKFVDGNNFIDRELFERQKKEGTANRLVGFKMMVRAIPREGYDLCNSEGEKIGRVCSGTMSPMLKVGIGTGYIDNRSYLMNGSIYVQIRGKILEAKIVKMPFI